jgi:hypothetical protein
VVGEQVEGHLHEVREPHGLDVEEDLALVKGLVNRHRGIGESWCESRRFAGIVWLVAAASPESGPPGRRFVVHFRPGASPARQSCDWTPTVGPVQSRQSMDRAGTWTARFSVVAFALWATGCASFEGPHFRYATQTAEALAAIQSEDVVWLEFQEGDVVPLEVRVAGLIDGETEAPIRLVARRTFYLVHRRGEPMRLSVDGERVLDAYPGRGLLAFGVEDGAPQLGLLLHLQGERPRTAGGEQ